MNIIGIAITTNARNIACSLALAALGSAGATAAHAQAVGVATGPQASLTNRMGSAVAKVVAM
ncbi:MAG: hypothetical protein AB7F96_14275 [Beijerinckiaceae bacterium]